MAKETSAPTILCSSTSSWFSSSTHDQDTTCCDYPNNASKATILWEDQISQDLAGYRTKIDKTGDVFLQVNTPGSGYLPCP